MPSAAILILNYNGRAHLETYLPEVIRSSENIPIIIGDNASTDDSVSWLQENHPDIRLIQFDSNLGYCKGYNQMVQKVTKDLLVIMNSDIRPTKGWLSPLFFFLEQNQDVAAIMPKILSDGQKDHFEYAGAAGGYLDKYGYPFCRGRVFNCLEKDMGQYDKARQVFWVSGACFVVRRNVFIKSGGFDESFFAHMEEIDLCWRLQRMGHRLVCLPKSKVFHLGGGTLAYNHPFKVYLNHRNGLQLLIKNLPVRKRVNTVTLRIWLDMIAIMYYLAKGRFGAAWSVIRALFDVLFKIGKRSKRANNFISSLDEDTQPILFDHSIVWQYFIRKKRRFTDLIPN